MTSHLPDPALRRVVLVVALLNLVYFGVEFGVAAAIGSVALFADSVDFLEDASVNILIFLAMAWSLRARARLGMVLAGILILPALALSWALWSKVASGVPPEPVRLSLTGLGAMLINGICALMLARFRTGGGSLARAAFLSARNDVIANVAIIAAGLVTARWPTIWPDVVVGIGIAIINLDAAREVWEAARDEHSASRP